VKVMVFFVAAAACGHAAPAPAPIANRAPSEIDAAPAEVDAADEECSQGESITVRVAGRDGSARLDQCVGTEEHHHGEDFVSHDARADLVLDRDGAPVTTTVAEWETGMEDTLTSTLAGALRSKSGEEALLVLNESNGPGEGIGGEGAALLVYAVRGDAWEKVHEVDANQIKVNVSSDRRVATVGTCTMDPAGPGAGSGGGGCDDDGDGKTIELRWDGEQVDEHELAP
jgi:hypothetical protein